MYVGRHFMNLMPLVSNFNLYPYLLSLPSSHYITLRNAIDISTNFRDHN